MLKSMFSILFAAIVLITAVSARRAATEEQRVEEWHAAGNTWPPNWQHETPEMKAVLERREREIMNITGADERWENWLQFVANRLVPKFTPVGFKVIQIPEPYRTKLFNVVEKPLQDFKTVPTEGSIDVIYHPPGMEPKFLNIGDLARELHHGLREIHEEWAGGIQLKPTSAYGIRFYQNGSSLAMHYDKIGTHVISSIVHVAHKYDNDSEPWPIQIEDHNGQLHAVNLEPGQMLFYESAKCLHGRMKAFKGEYYGSIFIHYQPVDRSIWDFSTDKVIASVPPHWREGVTNARGERWAGAVSALLSYYERADVIASRQLPWIVESAKLLLPDTQFTANYNESKESGMIIAYDSR